MLDPSSTFGLYNLERVPEVLSTLVWSPIIDEDNNGSPLTSSMLAKKIPLMPLTVFLLSNMYLVEHL